jgi:hypothetical protein
MLSYQVLGVRKFPFLELSPMRWARDRYIQGAQATLGETAFETARAEGRAMSSPQAIVFARQ